MHTALLICTALLAADSPYEVQAKRTKDLKASIKSFRFDLTYHGEEDKPFYRLRLSVPAAKHERPTPFFQYVQISEDQAETIIDHLAEDGFLSQARDADAPAKLPAGPLYLLRVQAGELDLGQILGWDLQMLRRLDGLRAAVNGQAAKSMVTLVSRFSGLRKEWEKKADASARFEVSAARDDSRIRFVSEGGTTVVHVASEFGIDKATIKRKADEWPKSMVLRLHLTGMESLKIGNGRETINLKVASTGKRRTFISLLAGEGELALGKGFPHWIQVRVVGGEWKFPLKQGYFEVPLPAGLFKRNSREITLEWVDFYRN